MLACSSGFGSPIERASSGQERHQMILGCCNLFQPGVRDLEGEPQFEGLGCRTQERESLRPVGLAGARTGLQHDLAPSQSFQSCTLCFELPDKVPELLACEGIEKSRPGGLSRLTTADDEGKNQSLIFGAQEEPRMRPLLPNPQVFLNRMQAFAGLLAGLSTVGLGEVRDVKSRNISQAALEPGGHPRHVQGCRQPDSLPGGPELHLPPALGDLLLNSSAEVCREPRAKAFQDASLCEPGRTAEAFVGIYL